MFSSILSGNYVNRYPSPQKLIKKHRGDLVDGICIALLAEGVLNPKDKNVTLIGGCSINEIDAAIEHEWQPERRIFCRPVDKDKKMLARYEATLNLPAGSYSVTEAVRRYLPKHFPMCKYLVIDFPPVPSQQQTEFLANNGYDNEAKRLVLTVNHGMLKKMSKGETYTLPKVRSLDDDKSHYRIPNDERIQFESMNSVITKICRKINGVELPITFENGVGNKDQVRGQFILYLMQQAEMLFGALGGCYISIPLRTIMQTKSSLLGAFWLVYNKPWKEVLKSEASLIESLYSNLLIPINHRLQSLIVIRQSEKMHLAQSRSASAAILSRNMAHHIGSHVILRSTVDDVYRRLKEFFICPPHKNISDYWARQSIARLKTRIDLFIQEKADFLAEITTDPNSSSDSKRMMRDVVHPFVGNALLMDTLARNEGFGYRTKNECTLKISLCMKQERSCTCLLGPNPPPYDPEFAKPKHRKMAEKEMSAEELTTEQNSALLDPEIAMPGQLGHYALYGILENIIRNAAKHGKSDEEEDFLHVHLHVEDDPAAPRDYFRLSIWDNRSKPDKKITAKIPGSQKNERFLADHLNDWLKADLIDEQGRVRREAWGIAEILICANLLAGNTDYKYDIQTVSITAGQTPDENQVATNCNGSEVRCRERRVIYNIRLLKAKMAVFVGKSFCEKWSARRRELELAGILIFEDAERLHEYMEQSTARQAFRFAVIENNVFRAVEEAKLRILRAGLPFRIIRVNGDFDRRDLIIRENSGDVLVKNNPFLLSAGELTPNRLHKQLWKTWLDGIRADHKSVTVGVYLDVGSEDARYKKWAKSTEWFNEDRSGSVSMCVQGTQGAIKGDLANAASVCVGFDRHGYIRMGEYLKPIDCYEVFAKGSPDYSEIMSSVLPINSESFWALPYAMAEAGLLRILVIDERFAEWAMTEYGNNKDNKDFEVLKRLRGKELGQSTPCLWHMAWRAKIFIATHLGVGEEPPRPLHPDSYARAEKSSNGKGQEAKTACPRLELRLTNKGLKLLKMDALGNGVNLSDDMAPFDIVVIHQGVLETHCSDEHQEQALGDWITKSNPWLVIESGRGIPPKIQKRAIRFLSFSALEQALTVNGIGKLVLTRRLMALPRFVEKGL